MNRNLSCQKIAIRLGVPLQCVKHRDGAEGKGYYDLSFGRSPRFLGTSVRAIMARYPR